MAIAQESGLEQTINLAIGEYSSDSLINAIEEQAGLRLSFASRNVKRENFRLQESNPSVREILQLIFNPSDFDYLLKPGKILIRKREPEKVETITISGYIEDVGSGERLIGANIFIPGSSIGTVSNTFGFFSLSVPTADSILVIVSQIGYKNRKAIFSKDLNENYNILLIPEVAELEEVTIVAEEELLSQTQMSNEKLKTNEIDALPKFLGEVDVIKAVQFLPGVQSGGEGSVNYIIRGGNPDQNLILLDGVPVYNVSHLFGFFSVFNIDAIKHVELTKGGFPAHFGGRLSSVLEVNMKEGDLQKYHGSGGIGLLSAKLALEGPIIKDKASFMISGRRTYSDLIYRPFLGPNDDQGYYFADLNAKLNYKINRKDRIYLSFYNGLDKAFSNELDGSNFSALLKWGNYTSALRWNHLFSKKLFGNLTATYSRFNFQIGSTSDVDSLSNTLNYFSRITDQGLRYDLDYILSPKHSFKMGAAYVYHNFRPGAINITESRAGSLNIDSLFNLTQPTFTHDMSLYIEDIWTINKRLKLNLGLHYSAYLVNDQFYNSLQPRISGRYLLNPNWALKASYAFMQQYIHLLTNSTIGLPTDLWVTSTDNIAPQNSHQLALGSTNYFKEKKWEWNNELFYKDLSGLIAFEPAASLAPAANWENQVVTGGVGTAYGWETMIKLNGKKTSGWIAYTLSKSERQFDDLNDGEKFPFKYDRRHDFKIVLNHNFTKRFSMGATWLFNTGIKATIPISTYSDLNGNPVIRYSKRNEFVYPNYHRLDLTLNWKKKTSWGERNWGMSVYNAYNRQNPFFIYFSTNGVSRTATQVSVFQFLPSFHYNFRF